MNISQEQLINIINTTNTSFLLGAGCSISSGCMSATNLVYEFKKRIYCSNNNLEMSKYNYMSDDLKNLLDSYFQEEKSDNDYSYYFEKCFPMRISRMNFIKEQFLSKQPSIGYKCFAKILIDKKIKMVYTTNFDNLIEKSLKYINSEYDITKCNDKYVPLTSSDILITELHGDYNYSLPKNTSQELESLSENTKETILSCTSQVLLIMGYSGADKSVMNALKEFITCNKTKSIIWCAFNNQINSEVKELMDYAKLINEDSCICDIKGFDELCLNYYNLYIEKDDKIDKFLRVVPKLEFSKKYSYNKKEILSSNLFEIFNFPMLYEVENIEFTKEIYDKINEHYIGQFNNKNLFFIGELEWLKSNFFNKTIKHINFTNEFFQQNKNISTKLIKDYIKKSIINANSDIKEYRRKLFFRNIKDKNDIHDGFSIDLISINNKVYLSFIQEYVYAGELSTKIKNLFLKKFSVIRNNTSLEWLNKLIEKIGTKLCLWGSILNYNEKALMLSELEYSLIEEQTITTNLKDGNISALQCINNSGIKKPIFKKNHIKIAIFCPEESRRDLAIYFKKLNEIVHSKDDIFPNFLGFENMFKVKIDYLLQAYKLKDCNNLTFLEYCQFILKQLENIKVSKNPDMFVIYTPKELERFEYSENKENNLHDFIKLHCAEKYITQFISQKSIISSDSIYKKIWNLAIAIYTKTIALPWQPSKMEQGNAFIGIGYGMSKNGIVVGCSQMFDSRGRGLQLLVKPISSKVKKNPYMTENEAYEVGKSLCNAYYNYYSTTPLYSIIIHKSTYFKKEEIMGFEKSFSHVQNIELIQIEDKPNIKAIKFNNYKSIDCFPLSRGTLVKINDNEALLWTHGTVCSPGFNKGKQYVKGGKGYPSPLLIRKFKGKMPLEDIAKDVLMLTKMDYNSADTLYSNTPVTIKYTDKVVDIIKQDNCELNLVDFRYII